MAAILTPERLKELETRVERGATALDAVAPNWWKVVNLEFLEMSRCTECVLGQVFGHFGEGMTRLTEGLAMVDCLDLEHYDGYRGRVRPERYGFDYDEHLTDEWCEEDEDAPPDEDHNWVDQMELYNDLWRELITRRRDETSGGA